MTQTEQQTAAKEFSNTWKDRGDEKSETHNFWIGLLSSVFGVEDAHNFIEFEKRVKLGHTSFIDAYIESTSVLIEQKSINIDLKKAYKQSDDELLTPFQQAHRYYANLPRSQMPRWIITCNFKSFLVYDMERPNSEPEEILLENLEKEYYRLSFIAQKNNIHLQKEMELSIKAGDIVGKIYDKLLGQYKNPDSEKTLKSLNMLCVRLVFCLYAEDAGIFKTKSQFHDYLENCPPENIRTALIELFKTLDTKEKERDPEARDDLLAFPYVNGGLFSDEDLSIPQFNSELKELLLTNASNDFDWSDISPTIFGAVFESTLNPETRRSGGMHYTSIENIHKVIDPLFMNDLQAEFDEICKIKTQKNRNDALFNFQKKLGSLKFLDPACGSGNFLTESYISLRRLENKAIKEQIGEERLFDFDHVINVNINQFYGIEINDFAAVVAKTALWIAESQMMKETSLILDYSMDFLPLKTNANITEANALRIDWGSLLQNQGGESLPLAPAGKPSSATPSSGDTPQRPVFDFIMGNPPFVGARLMSEEQKKDVFDVWQNEKNIGNVDYVSCWYKKCADLIENTNTRCALVSTNSITQGEQVAIMWKPLMQKGIQIDFAYRTFRWDSEATIKAHVHCVIIGFSHEIPVSSTGMTNGATVSASKNTVSASGEHVSASGERVSASGERVSASGATVSLSGLTRQSKPKTIYLNEEQSITAKNINGYLLDAKNIFIEKRAKSICGNIPELTMGSMPNDGGHLLLNEEKRQAMIKSNPLTEKYIKQIKGAEEFINNKKLYCLWLVGVSPSEIKKMPEILQRVEAVRITRQKSKREATKKLADIPMLFAEIRQPKGNYIAIPKVSSEKRKYIPMSYETPDIIAKDQLFVVPDADLFYFGVLTSNVHNAWMRAVCGRLEMRYNYSNTIVYNNFPWPTPTDEQKAKIEQTAQAILDARALYPDCSLADLYDQTLMPKELRAAHQENDKAVMASYGFNYKTMSESECVAKLFELYEELVGE